MFSKDLKIFRGRVGEFKDRERGRYKRDIEEGENKQKKI